MRPSAHITGIHVLELSSKIPESKYTGLANADFWALSALY